MDDNKVTYNEDQFGNQTTVKSTDTVDSYVKKTAKNGRELFFMNGKLISKDKIPEGAMIKTSEDPLPKAEFEAPVEVPDTIQEAIKDRLCIVGDGNDGTYIKFVNGQFISLCTEHFTNTTTGELVQLIRESVVNE